LKKAIQILTLLVILTTCLSGVPRTSFAADPTFVGVLAFAVEDSGAKRLGLSDEARQSLLQLIDKREQEALSMVLKIKDLPPAEIAKELAPFVRKSELLGMELLTLEQREILKQIRVARAGLALLGDPEFATVLQLDESQKATVATLLQQRDVDMTKGGESQRRITKSIYERKLAAVMTQTQRSAWEQLTGMSGPAPRQATSPVATVPVAQADNSPAEAIAPPASADDGDSEATDDVPAKATERTISQPPAVAVDPRAAPDGAKLRFSFNYHPWPDVLEWFAEQSDLSIQIDLYPEGTFNYTDRHYYTASEALDIMNRVLLTKGYTLVRTGRLLTLIDLEDPIPPQLVELVSISKLDERGEFELVKCLFQLAKWDPSEAAEEIGKLIGPQGSVTALPTAGQILVMETGGKLREIRNVIDGVENPDGARGEGIQEFALEHASPEEFLAIARPLLGLAEDENSNDEIKIAIDSYSNRLFVTGSRKAIQMLQDLVPRVDRAPEADDRPITPPEQPQLATYQIIKADPNQVLMVTQTLMAGLPDVRLAIDEVTKKLVVLARPSEQQLIIETLRQLEGDAPRVEVIQLRRMDPQLVILAINKLFGTDEEGATGPRVDGDPISMKLWVRGTSAEIAQIQELCDKLEGPDLTTGQGLRRSVRILPFSGPSAQSALSSAELIWNSMRPNAIRTITPSAISSSIRQHSAPRTETPPREAPREYVPRVPPRDFRGPPPNQPSNPEPSETPATDSKSNRNARLDGLPTNFVSWVQDGQPVGGGEGLPVVKQETPSPSDKKDDTTSKKAADIVISFTAEGVIIASEDLEALDEFEALVRSLMDTTSIAGPQPTVIWLRYAKADVAAALLTQILTGGAASGGGSLLGDMASGLLGGGGGSGLLGGLLGGGGGSMLPTGAPSIIADMRLNALIIQANPLELQLIEQLLPIIDREGSPEAVETAGKPRLIPVYYMTADDMAAIIRSVYSNRMVSASGGSSRSSGGQSRQPSPEDFIRALRGGGRGGQNPEAKSEISKMALGVDARSNSLVVAAPEPLFREVEELVAKLDRQGVDSEEGMVVLKMKGASAEMIANAIGSLTGGSVTSTASGSTSSSGGSSRPSSSGGTSGATSADAIRQRIDFFRSLGGRGGGTGGGFGGRGGPPGGSGGFGRGGSTGGRGGGPPGGSRGGGR
jgi:type II secretory pathway component GspD/PulD (secretin)